MKGIETRILLEIIVAILILIILFIIVVNPSLVFGKQTGEQTSFRQFCFHWSILGYPTTKDEIEIGKYNYSISEYCKNAGTSDIDACKKLCEGLA